VPSSLCVFEDPECCEVPGKSPLQRAVTVLALAHSRQACHGLARLSALISLKLHESFTGREGTQMGRVVRSRSS
jgi:hypothetical protein